MSCLRHAPHDAKQGMQSPARPFDVPRYGDKHFCIRTLQGGEIDLWEAGVQPLLGGSSDRFEPQLAAHRIPHQLPAF